MNYMVHAFVPIPRKLMRGTSYRVFLLVIIATFLAPRLDGSAQSRYVLTTRGEELLLSGRPFLVKGLRCSNALMSDAATSDLIAHLDTFAIYGINTVSVYFMGSRFGDVKGYRSDASIDPAYGARMERILKAADQRGMVVLVGVLYWGTSRAIHENWTQEQANHAVANTVAWLKDRGYRNVFVDVDNEGMAERARGFDPEALIRAGKTVDPSYLIAYNGRSVPGPASADLHIHFARPVAGKPYIETEGTVDAGTPDGYWSSYSKRPDLYNYINVGVYNDTYKKAQMDTTAAHLRRGQGYMLASTWLQAVPLLGPNQSPGGSGTPSEPGIRWWLEYVRDTFGGAYGPDR